MDVNPDVHTRDVFKILVRNLDVLKNVIGNVFWNFGKVRTQEVTQ